MTSLAPTDLLQNSRSPLGMPVGGVVKTQDRCTRTMARDHAAVTGNGGVLNRAPHRGVGWGSVIVHDGYLTAATLQRTPNDQTAFRGQPCAR